MATTTAPRHQAQPSWTGSIMNLLNPFASPTDDVRDATTTTTIKPTDQQQTTLKRPILSAVLANVNDPGPPSPSRSSGSIMFAEPDTRSTSETGSREGSIDGRRRGSKRSGRPKTQFSICHPPPEGSVRQKLHRRPRSLLQLHRLSASARPRPALEVIPSANFSVRLTRAITRVFKAKHGLCPNDLVVLKAEKYSSEEADEEQEVRDVIGLICKGRKDDDKDKATAGGKATIHLASGRVWDASPTANGGYEFSTVDEHGLTLTVRWWPKRAKDGSKQKMKRFNFSTISPNSRKHPVVATLSSSGLDIYDSYTIPEPASKTPLSSPKNASFSVDDDDDEESTGKEQCETDDQLREIITITSIWVTFKEGWSPSFKYDEKDATGSCISPTKFGTTPIASPPGSPAQVPLEKRSSIKSISSGIVRRTSILKSHRTSSQSVPEQEIQSPSRSSSFRKTGRARADSSSTVLVHRAASNRRKNNSQATWRPDLLHAQDVVPEASREDLSPNNSPIAAKTTQPPTPDTTGSGATKGEQEVSPHSRSRTTLDKPEHRESTSTAKTDVSSGVSEPARKVSATQREESIPKKMVRRSSGKKNRKSVWKKLTCRG